MSSITDIQQHVPINFIPDPNDKHPKLSWGENTYNPTKYRKFLQTTSIRPRAHFGLGINPSMLGRSFGRLACRSHRPQTFSIVWRRSRIGQHRDFDEFPSHFSNSCSSIELPNISRAWFCGTSSNLPKNHCEFFGVICTKVENYS
ncbi:hypothetical protein DMENIID0001_075570 [Sergentomyia squamirostris]